MSGFGDFNTFQGQPAADESGAPNATGGAQQQAQMGQPIESASGQFPSATMGGPAPTAGSPQGSQSKTTLW